jgi:hypothetical protein
MDREIIEDRAMKQTRRGLSPPQKYVLPRACFVAAALFLCWPGEIRGLSCPRPAEIDLLHPRAGETVPRNTVIYVKLWDRTPRSLRTLELITRPGDRPVAVRVLTGERSHLVRIRPENPLVGGSRYAIRYRGKVRGSFKTSRATASDQPPRLAASRVVFSRPWPRKLVPPAGVPRGRTATLKLGGSPLPTVVEVALWFDNRRRGGWVPHRARPDLQITGGACSHDAPRVAPNHGRYTLELRPWSAAGRVGRTIRRTGVIR